MAPTTGEGTPLVAAAVPIAVWRLDNHGDDQLATERGHRLVSRLATRLVRIYSSRGDIVVDLDNLPHWQHEVTSAGRVYLAGSEQAVLTNLSPIETLVGLIILRCSCGVTPSVWGRLAGLLATYRHLTTGGTTWVAAVCLAEPGPAFADHEKSLRAVSDLAGLTRVRQIVAVSASREGDQFLYYATPSEADQAAKETTVHGDPVVYVDLFVLAARMGCHA